MPEILVVEDEPAIAESIAYTLEKASHRATVANTLGDARQLLRATTDLVVLDLMLPDGSGFDWIDELSASGSSSPAIIVLSSRDAEADRVRALEAGADDYISKPFSPREVVARVTAVLRRRSTAQGAQNVGAWGVAINEMTRRATVGQRSLDLTRVEFDLLALLASRPGQVFSRATIINDVWGEGFALSDRTIDSHIKALRKKIVEAGGGSGWIETVRGIGYRLLEPEKLS